jgi:hypothetical protein
MIEAGAYSVAGLVHGDVGRPVLLHELEAGGGVGFVEDVYRGPLGEGFGELGRDRHRSMRDLLFVVERRSELDLGYLLD